MVMVNVDKLERGATAEAARVTSRAFLRNPLHVAAFKGDSEALRRRQEAMYKTILLPASRRCHTAPARNAALCPTLLPQRAARSCPAPCSLKSKKAANFSDFAGSGVDTH